jgi:hypothetical protein
VGPPTARSLASTVEGIGELIRVIDR